MQGAPEIFVPSSHVYSTFLLLMVDPSYNATDPTNTVLHTIIGNLTISRPRNNTDWDSDAVTLALKSAQPPIAPYIGPEPQPNQPSHNYTLMVFSQPKNFKIPGKYNSWLPLNLSDVYTRVNFPVVDFVRETKLGQPVAATYFRLNLTNAAATISANTTATASGLDQSTTTAASNAVVNRASSPILFRAISLACAYILG